MADVQCLLCGELFPRGIKFHIKKCHGITNDEYRKMFPGAQIISDKEMLEKQTRVHSEEEIRGLIERNKSSKMRNLISERNKDPEFQKKCQEGCTEETRKAQSENMRKVSLECWKDPEYRKRISQVASETQKRENQKPEVQKRKSELSKQLWSDPEFAKKAIEAPKKHPYGKQSYFVSDKFNKEFYCRSQGESDFLNFCEESEFILDVTSGTSLPIKYISNEEEHIYIPDFIVKTTDNLYVIEIKYEDDSIENYKDKVNGAVTFCHDHNMKFCYINRFSGMKKVLNNGLESVVVSERI